MVSTPERTKSVRWSLRQSDFGKSKIVNKLRTAAIFVYIYVRDFFRWKNLFATILNSFFSFINGSLVRCKCSMRWRSALMIKKLSLLKNIVQYEIFSSVDFSYKYFPHLKVFLCKKKFLLGKKFPYCTLYCAKTYYIVNRSLTMTCDKELWK